MKTVIGRLLLGAVVLAAVASVAGCSSKTATPAAVTPTTATPTATPTPTTTPSIQQGVLTDFKYVIKNSQLNPNPVLSVTLTSGEKIKVTRFAKTVKSMKVGQTLELKKIQVNGKDVWMVTRVVKNP